MENTISAEEPGTIRAMFAKIAPRYDRANLLLSFGQDKHWRRRVARLAASWSPQTILDLATGSGVLAFDLRAKAPDARIVGADFCAPMLELARRRGLDHLVVADGMALPFRDRIFDLVTVAFGLRNMANYDQVLGELYRVMKPAGHLIILDFSIPPVPFSWLYRPYLHWILPRLAGLLTGEPGAYSYLACSIEKFPRGADFLRRLESAGFGEARAQPLSCGVVSLYSATKV
jgi:demethylmenaquinone methyltransferase/2-methoxy-6-polyprenyl-1,4-benzoquinol methylase